MSAPFTTPYVQPGACWDIVGGELGTTVTGGTTYGLKATNLYSECLPPSWQTLPPESRYSASPAVCPQGWRYWDIATSEVADQVVTTAWCCDYYEELYSSDDYPVDGYSKPCVLDEGGETDLHIPWHITWQESDLPNLSRQPPTLDPGMMISSWLPGAMGMGPPEQVPLPTSTPEPEPSTTPGPSPASTFPPSTRPVSPSPSSEAQGSSSHARETISSSPVTSGPALESTASSGEALESPSTSNAPNSTEGATTTPAEGGAVTFITLPNLVQVAVGLILSVGLASIVGLD